MYRYLMSRLMLLLISLFGLTILVFVLLRVVPGNVAVFIAGPDASVAQVEQLRAELGLDDALPVQYARWLAKVVQGDLGRSLFTHETIAHALQLRLPVTFQLGGLSLVLAVLLSFPAGIISAVKADSWTDQSLRLLTIVGLAIPHFWLATMTIVLGARWFNWIPPIGYVSLFDDPWRNFQQFALPTIILGTGLAASLARMMRSSMLEVVHEDYIRTARAKGLDTYTIIRRHMLKNALIPVVTLFGIQAGTVVGGTVILESIFNLPGMGRLVIEAINRRDYPIVQGVVLAFGTFVLVVNLLTDVIYTWLDPRISYS